MWINFSLNRFQSAASIPRSNLRVLTKLLCHFVFYQQCVSSAGPNRCCYKMCLVETVQQSISMSGGRHCYSHAGIYPESSPWLPSAHRLPDSGCNSQLLLTLVKASQSLSSAASGICLQVGHSNAASLTAFNRSNKRLTALKQVLVINKVTLIFKPKYHSVNL